MLKLYHNDMSVCAQKVRMVLAHKNLEWQGPNVDLRSGEQFSPQFRKINPKGLIPVLINDKQVVTESNVIIEYLEEVFPDSPLMPSSPIERANVRVWLTRLDAGLHEHVAVISFCIAFRHQMLKKYPTEDALQDFFNKIADPNRKAVMQDMVINGMDSPRLHLASFAYNKLIKDLSEALTINDFIAGEDISLADYAFFPYIERLEQLQLSAWWSDAPQITQWMQKIRRTRAYEVGIGEWLNPTYTGMMKALGADAWPQIKLLLKN